MKRRRQYSTMICLDCNHTWEAEQGFDADFGWFLDDSAFECPSCGGNGEEAPT